MEKKEFLVLTSVLCGPALKSGQELKQSGNVEAGADGRMMVTGSLIIACSGAFL